jgi:hypothetical protein
MSNAFFEAVESNPDLFKAPAVIEFRAFYKQDGEIIEIQQVDQSLPSEGDYIVITEAEYENCYYRLSVFKMRDGELKHFPPAHRSWYLEQHELDMNPWFKE